MINRIVLTVKREQMLRSLLFILTSPLLLYANPYDILCIKVIDGDSFHGQKANGEIGKYRIFGIDCPEQGQPYGDSATHYLCSLILNKIVHVDSLHTDPYKRTVCKLYEKPITHAKGAKKDHAIQLLEKGYAWWTERYAPHEVAYRTAQATARRSKKGLWASDTPIAPWLWRKLSKKERKELEIRFTTQKKEVTKQ